MERNINESTLDALIVGGRADALTQRRRKSSESRLQIIKTFNQERVRKRRRRKVTCEMYQHELLFIIINKRFMEETSAFPPQKEKGQVTFHPPADSQSSHSGLRSTDHHCFITSWIFYSIWLHILSPWMQEEDQMCVLYTPKC